MIPTTISSCSGAGAAASASAPPSSSRRRAPASISPICSTRRGSRAASTPTRAPARRARPASIQFIDQTWLGTVKQARRRARPRLGRRRDPARAERPLPRRRPGRCAARSSICAASPRRPSAMAAEFASDNRAYLERRLGRAGRAGRSLSRPFPRRRRRGALPARPRRQSRTPRPPRSCRPRRAPTAGCSTIATASPRSFAEIRERFAEQDRRRRERRPPRAPTRCRTELADARAPASMLSTGAASRPRRPVAAICAPRLSDARRAGGLSR